MKAKDNVKLFGFVRPIWTNQKVNAIVLWQLYNLMN